MNKIRAILWSLIVVFILLIASFVYQSSFDSTQKPFYFIAVLGFLFLALGIVLIIIISKKKVKKPLKTYLLLTGISAIGPFAGSILHNVFYAFAVLSENIAVLKFLMEILHAGFFILALLICPIGFLIGVIGSLCKMRKKRK